MALGFGGRAVEALSLGAAVDVDPRTGAASLRVPVPVPAGRGLAPSLALVYGSGAGNSAFGAGWALAGLPAVTVAATRRLPRWDGRDGFELAGDELVPWLEATGGTWAPRTWSRGDWAIAAWRSRRGASKVRVEQWTHRPSGRVHFRTRDPANVVTIYGARAGTVARLADPDDPDRTFAWLPEVQVDPHGNALRFEYAAETLDGVDRGAPYEHVRPSLAQRYLKRIRYGNSSPIGVGDDGPVLPAELRWAFEVAFDFGDHAASTPMPDRPWPARSDAFSTARPGFELRTHRLCRRILAFHDLPELGATPTLVGALTLTHDLDPAGATLREIGYAGHRNDGSSRAIPPLRLTYAPTATATSFTELPSSSSVNLPAGLADRRTQLVDLFGEGVPGLLTERDRAWHYKPNLGGGVFGDLVALDEHPAPTPGSFGVGDLDRDGDTDYVRTVGRQAGAYRLDRERARWLGFQPFASLPHLEALGGRAQWVDLNGDGRPDLVVARPDSLLWFASDGDAFEPAVEIPRPDSRDRAPICAADADQDLYFADMTGDGLADLVRVQNGRVEYWPSLGNGRFGDVVVMDDVPHFAGADFDARRMRFVDLDGSGTTDLVYLGAGEVTCWINASGNRLVPGPRLSGLPIIDNLASAQIADLLGDGRACLVWSQPLPGHAPLAYLPLTPAVRPRLLLAVDDARGRESRLSYSSSATHYLRDQASGRGWSTRLPGHPIVVDRLETIDHVSDTRTVQRFAYHDGHYDGGERQFRGFGQVDTWDADAADGSAPGPGAAAFAAPALTRTWFHLGTPMWNHQRITDQYDRDPDLPVFAPHELVDAHGIVDVDDGLRALAGQPLRREVYAVDEHGTPAPHPFAVEQHRYRVRSLQPPMGAPAAWSWLPCEDATWSYEGGTDPRIAQHVVLETDERDTILRDATIAYARRGGVHEVDAQARTWIAIADRRVVHLDGQDRHELAIPIEERRFELAGVRPAAGLFTRAELRAASVAIATPAPHYRELSDDPTRGPEARLRSWDQHRYWNDTRDQVLPLGAVGGPLLLHHDEAAAFDVDFVAATIGDRARDPLDDARLRELGYVTHDGLWWQPGPVHAFTTAANFSQLAATTRSDGATTAFTYDPHDLAVVATTDPIGTTTAELDYHQLAAWRITDPNGNATEVRYDPLGVVVASSAYGHVDDAPWGHAPLPSQALGVTVAELLAAPLDHLGGAATVTAYDLDAWARDRTPTTIVRVAREDLLRDGTSNGHIASDRVQLAVAYLDGLGRPLQDKTRVEPGPAITRAPDGSIVTDAGGRPVLTESATRWRASGHVDYDAKGRPGRTYEPYFTTTPAFEGGHLARFGTSTLTRYDAVGRVVGQDFANGTTARATYAAWTTTTADPNDTVLDSSYRALRVGLPADHPERQALEHALAHADTPTIALLDPLGRTVATIATGGTDGDRRTETRLDLDGRAVAAIDPRGLVAFTFQHDLRGRVFAQTSVDAGDAFAIPDAFDRVVTTGDARGVQVDRTFDLVDRPVATRVRDGGLDAVVEQIVYGDALTDRAAAIRANLVGRVAVVRDSAGVVTIERVDPTGRPLATTRRLRADADTTPEPDWRASVPLEPDAFTLSGRYDALGRTISDTLPDGATRAYDYLASGTVARIRVTTPDGQLVDTPILDGAAIDARGQRTALTLGNGVALAYAYDPDTFRLRSQVTTRGARVLQDLRSTYDPVGNLVRLTDAAQEPGAGGAIVRGVTVSARRDFTYDAHYRLRRATGRVHQALLAHDYIPGAGGTIKGTRHLSLDNGAALERYAREFDYDPSGNLRAIRHLGDSQQWTTDFWIAPSSNRAVPALDPNGNPVADPAAQFDAAGNLVSLAHLRALAWSWRGTLARAVLIARPGGLDDDERYLYGGDAQRLRKRATRVVHDGQREVTEVVRIGDSERTRILRDGTILLERWTTHVSDGTQRLAVVHRWTIDTLARDTDDITQPRIHYQLNTHQGSAALELDRDGRIISYEEYFPHGATAFLAGDDLREVRRKTYRYSGKETDDATGLIYYGYRYLAPWLGRWLSPDPAGPIDDLNLYQFVLGDPVGNVDPNGLETPTLDTSLPYESEGYADLSEADAIKRFNSRKGAESGRIVTAAEQDEHKNWVASGWHYAPGQFEESDKGSKRAPPGSVQRLFDDAGDFAEPQGDHSADFDVFGAKASHASSGSADDGQSGGGTASGDGPGHGGGAAGQAAPSKHGGTSDSGHTGPKGNSRGPTDGGVPGGVAGGSPGGTGTPGAVGIGVIGGHGVLPIRGAGTGARAGVAPTKHSAGDVASFHINTVDATGHGKVDATAHGDPDADTRIRGSVVHNDNLDTPGSTPYGEIGGSPTGEEKGSLDGTKVDAFGALDALAKVAGVANLEFGASHENGQSGGVPGGHGSGWGVLAPLGQVLYIGLTAFSWTIGPMERFGRRLINGAKAAVNAAKRAVAAMKAVRTEVAAAFAEMRAMRAATRGPRMAAGHVDDAAGGEFVDDAIRMNEQPLASPTADSPPRSASFGHSDSTDYRETFFEANPETRGEVKVHHAVEQQARTRYPDIVNESQMHSLENLRGIPNEINSQIHLSEIRKIWNRFYKSHPSPTVQDLLDQATEIDNLFGHLLRPPVRP